jgi:hypothetical protein
MAPANDFAATINAHSTSVSSITRDVFMAQTIDLDGLVRHFVGVPQINFDLLHTAVRP